MTRVWLLIGCVTIVSGLVSYYATAEMGTFSALNLGIGALALLAALASGLRSLGSTRRGEYRGSVQNVFLGLVALTWGAYLAVAFASASGLSLDFTFEGRFQIAEATCAALEALPAPAHAFLYFDPGDPRVRRTRLLLDTISERCGNLEVESRELSNHPEEEDFFGIASSNSVVLELSGARRAGSDDWQLVERPLEGTLFEALSRLGNTGRKVLFVSVGTGEGDFGSSDPLGFSGLRAALETEGYALRPLPSAILSQIPAEADGVLVIAPERRLSEQALAGLERYLEQQGGRLIAFLEPGSSSGLEELLAKFGLASPNRVVVDPASGSADGLAPGLGVVAHNYSDHGVASGLSGNRMTYFPAARSFVPHKADPKDRLRSVVYSSGDAWTSEDVGAASAPRTPARPAGVSTGYQPLVVTGEYVRGGSDARIVAFGDAGFASNRYLRTLYNLDLVMNAIHWALDRGSDITLRPKTATVVQFPVPVQNSLRAFYGVGLLIPELLLLGGGLVWLRRRGA